MPFNIKILKIILYCFTRILRDMKGMMILIILIVVHLTFAHLNISTAFSYITTPP